MLWTATMFLLTHLVCKMSVMKSMGQRSLVSFLLVIAKLKCSNIPFLLLSYTDFVAYSSRLVLAH